ncbi:MAG: hypothetical protein AAF871_16235 [Pseudomonadota bacterium]
MDWLERRNLSVLPGGTEMGLEIEEDGDRDDAYGVFHELGSLMESIRADPDIDQLF